jgi:hypothetical protein
MVGTPMEVPEPSTVNCTVVPEVLGQVPDDVSSRVSAEAPIEVEWNCKVFADMMRMRDAARYIVTAAATGLWPWWPLERLARPAPD